MGDVDTTANAGLEHHGYCQGAASTDPWNQFVVPVYDRIVSYAGRANTFITPGRATASQRLIALHNATASPVYVNINRIRVDLFATVSKIITTEPPIIRVRRLTSLPTGGNAIPKIPLNSTMTSDAAVTLWGDASADGVISGSLLTIASTGILDQVYAPRLLGATTGAAMTKYEEMDAGTFFEGATDVLLRALEGVTVILERATTGPPEGNPITDMWTATIDWEEYARP